MARATAGFIEDSDEDFALFSRVFSLHWDLERWATGEAATQEFASASERLRGLQVVMVDHDLPGMNGIAVIEWIRGSADGDVPLICMVSGTGRPGISTTALAAGADAFFAKPNSVAGLRELASDVFELARAR